MLAAFDVGQRGKNRNEQLTERSIGVDEVLLEAAELQASCGELLENGQGPGDASPGQPVEGPEQDCLEPAPVAVRQELLKAGPIITRATFAVHILSDQVIAEFRGPGAELNQLVFGGLCVCAYPGIDGRAHRRGA